MRDIQARDQSTGIRVIVNDLIVEYAVQCFARADVDAGADGALVQVRPAP